MCDNYFNDIELTGISRDVVCPLCIMFMETGPGVSLQLLRLKMSIP